MGTGDKPGFLASKWTTIALIALLVVLVIAFIWIQSAGGFSSFFERFKKKKEVKPLLRPVMNHQLYEYVERPNLELADRGFITITKSELS